VTLVDSIEALLFASDAPVPTEALARACGVGIGQVEQALELLTERLEGTALTVVEIAGGLQLCTRSEHAELIANFLKPQRQRLSRSLLEVLAVVAYRQPITLADIETVRGVQSDYSVRALLERRLIREVGRKPTPGRPVLYGTTQQFLHQFHLNSLDDLPKIAEEETPMLPETEGAPSLPLSGGGEPVGS
jgi:segregation and condensation protein B